MPGDLVQEAAVCGLDPMEGWDRTPGELMEYILAARERQRRRRDELGSLAYYLGGHINQCVWGSPRQGWQAFPGFLAMPEQSGEELAATLDAWAGCEPGTGTTGPPGYDRPEV